MTPRRIAFLGFDGITELDLVGPAEAFASAFLDGPGAGPRRCYEVLVIGLTGKPFMAESGIVHANGGSAGHSGPRMATGERARAIG